MKVLIVGLHGPAFSGKDTAAHLLASAVKKDVVVVTARLAEPIYQMIRTQLPSAHSGMSKAEKERPRRELGGLSVRQMAIAIAEGSRKSNPMVWVNIWREQLNSNLEYLDSTGQRHVLVLVPDLRMEHERRALESANGTITGAELGGRILHIKPIGAERLDNPCPTTEAALVVKAGEAVVTSDHRAGLDKYAAELMTGLVGSMLTAGVAGENFFEVFDPTRPLEEVAKSAERRAEAAHYHWASQS